MEVDLAIGEGRKVFEAGGEMGSGRGNGVFGRLTLLFLSGSGRLDRPGLSLERNGSGCDGIEKFAGRNCCFVNVECGRLRWRRRGKRLEKRREAGFRWCCCFAVMPGVADSFNNTEHLNDC